MSTHSEEFVTCTTADGLELDGFFISPASSHPPNSRVVVMVHGLAMNYYSPLFVSLGSSFSKNGLASFLFNNRGHDLASTRDDFDQKHGAAWEVLEDAALDIEAAVGFALSRGFKEVFLLGHSLGGLKVVFYLDQAQTEAVSGVILLSPVKSMPEIYKYRLGDQYQRVLSEAQRNRGDGYRLINFYPVSPYVLSVRTIRSFMAEDSKARISNYLPGITCPTVIFLDRSEAEIPLDVDKRRPQVESIRIPEADHFYNDCSDALAETILTWIADK